MRYLILAVVGLLLAPMVLADPTQNATVAAQAGNVTALSIQAESDSNSWAAFYGNISADKNLDDSNNNSFYTWGNATPAGEVFATRNATIQWGSVNCTNTTQVSAEETYLGQFPTDSDSVSNTFNETTHPQFIVATETIISSSCFSTNANVNGTVQNETWYQILLSDNSSNIIYTSIIEDEEYSFNGQLADFQLMVGENEKPGNEGPTTYYFWTELS